MIRWLVRRRAVRRAQSNPEIQELLARGRARDAYVNPDGGPPYHPYDPVNDPHSFTRWHGPKEGER